MKISLRAYNHFIDNLIDSGKPEEAIAHCSHILFEFPKYLESYRILGKAFLVVKNYEAAQDIFLRTLVAVPDDFISHVGLSIIREEQIKIIDATWHMERAFEVQPSNAAIQSELQRLYARRDGIAPPGIRMTRGALAQMYVKGELYPQAIAEIRAILSEDPGRSDMQLLLAQVYFRDGTAEKALETCEQLLKRYPYCFDANRIMVDVLRRTSQHSTTGLISYLDRVIELDPYARYSEKSVFQSYLVNDDTVQLNMWEEKKISPSQNVISSISQETASISRKEEDEFLNVEGTLRVFLCHASNDKPKVLDLYNRLKNEVALKIDPWLDKEKLLPGDDWDLEIRKAVRTTDIIIVCLSKNSTTKEGYIQKEIRQALDVAQEKPPGTLFIIPLKLEECIVPDGILQYQWLDYSEEGAYKRLLAAFRKRQEKLVGSL